MSTTVRDHAPNGRSKIGEYEIVSRLGLGGMGAVYLGVHPVIGKRVAIKVLLPQFSSDKALVRRFTDEARTISAIHHRGIIDIYAFGQLDDGAHYFVMEYLEGCDFSEVVRKRAPVPVADALRWADEILDALSAAHAAGVVHRDVKPSNLFLVDVPRRNPYVKLLDFGIAKQTPKDAATLQNSASGILGSPDYMAPEQIRGERVRPSADLYGLGCVLFELLSGKRPFVGTNYVDVMFKKLERAAPRLSSLRPDIPPSLDALIADLLQREPTARPRDAETVRSRIADIRFQIEQAGEEHTEYVSLPQEMAGDGTDSGAGRLGHSSAAPTELRPSPREEQAESDSQSGRGSIGSSQPTRIDKRVDTPKPVTVAASAVPSASARSAASGSFVTARTKKRRLIVGVATVLAAAALGCVAAVVVFLNQEPEPVAGDRPQVPPAPEPSPAVASDKEPQPQSTPVPSPSMFVEPTASPAPAEAVVVFGSVEITPAPAQPAPTTGARGEPRTDAPHASAGTVTDAAASSDTPRPSSKPAPTPGDVRAKFVQVEKALAAREATLGEPDVVSRKLLEQARKETETALTAKDCRALIRRLTELERTLK